MTKSANYLTLVADKSSGAAAGCSQGSNSTQVNGQTIALIEIMLSFMACHAAAAAREIDSRCANFGPSTLKLRSGAETSSAISVAAGRREDFQI